MKVGELRDLLANVPDDMPVVVYSTIYGGDSVMSHKVKRAAAPHGWTFGPGDGGQKVAGIEIARDEPLDGGELITE